MFMLDEKQMTKRINNYVKQELANYKNINEFEIYDGDLTSFIDQNKVFTIKFTFKHLKEKKSFDFYYKYDGVEIIPVLELPQIQNSKIGFDILNLYEQFEAIQRSYIYDIISFVKKT